MSFRLMGQALSVKTGSCITKMVLLKLCDNANDKGECWPSQETIADHCEVSRETVNRHIKKLIEKGIIKAENRSIDGIKTTCRYTIFLDVTESHNRCDGESLTDVTESHINLPEEPIIKENIKEKFKNDVREAWEKLGGNEYMKGRYIHEFFEHWTEASKSGKMRYEKEQFFEIPKRIGTWKKNALRFGKISDGKANPNVRRNA